jgi:hypothetical protein
MAGKHSELAPALIALGMTSFLAAATQAPLTSFIIVMEMINGRSMVLSLMAGAMMASMISRLISRPLYHTLSELMIGAALKVGAPPERATPEALPMPTDLDHTSAPTLPAAPTEVPPDVDGPEEAHEPPAPDKGQSGLFDSSASEATPPDVDPPAKP